MSSELIEAARAGDLDKARSLLAAGAAIDARDETGRTPLMLAAHAGNLSLVAALLAAGADVNASADGGWTAISLAVYNAEAKRGFRRCRPGPGRRRREHRSRRSATAYAP